MLRPLCARRQPKQGRSCWRTSPACLSFNPWLRQFQHSGRSRARPWGQLRRVFSRRRVFQYALASRCTFREPAWQVRRRAAASLAGRLGREGQRPPACRRQPQRSVTASLAAGTPMRFSTVTPAVVKHASTAVKPASSTAPDGQGLPTPAADTVTGGQWLPTPVHIAEVCEQPAVVHATIPHGLVWRRIIPDSLGAGRRAPCRLLHRPQPFGAGQHGLAGKDVWSGGRSPRHRSSMRAGHAAGRRPHRGDGSERSASAAGGQQGDGGCMHRHAARGGGQLHHCAAGATHQQPHHDLQRER